MSFLRFINVQPGLLRLLLVVVLHQGARPALGGSS
jgi:hypothetical protein